MSLNDPEHVREEYATEAGLEGRRAAYRWADGPDAPELLFETVARLAPAAVLEVGCGPGELSERVRLELGASVVAIDISPRMVELAQSRGVDARLGDAQDLPFADASFDCVVAAWMLYHVPDVDRALGEFARVLRPGGRLVAVTNYLDHLSELRALGGFRVRSPRSAATTARSFFGGTSSLSTNSTREERFGFPTRRRSQLSACVDHTEGRGGAITAL